MTPIEQQVYKYCSEGPRLGQIIVRDGKKGILFTGPDSPDGGEFIPFDDLGYNSDLGFFRKSDFPGEISL